MATRRRDLLVVGTGKLVGYITLDDGEAAFAGGADRTFAPYRRRLGDVKAAQLLLDEGWSNGYLYLAPPPEDARPK